MLLKLQWRSETRNSVEIVDETGWLWLSQLLTYVWSRIQGFLPITFYTWGKSSLRNVLAFSILTVFRNLCGKGIEGRQESYSRFAKHTACEICFTGWLWPLTCRHVHILLTKGLALLQLTVSSVCFWPSKLYQCTFCWILVVHAIDIVMLLKAPFLALLCPSNHRGHYTPNIRILQTL